MESEAPAGFSEKLAGSAHRRQSLRLWLRLFSCATVVEKRIRNWLESEFGTTLPRFDALAAVERRRDGMTMSELSGAMMVSNGNATGIVARLVEDGLLVRTPDPEDARVTAVRLSPKGRAAFARMAAAHAQWIDEMFTDLTEDEVGELLRLLKKLRLSVEAHGTSP
ncbi:MAG: MarR family transcriptional regulator [Steroidobacteraceae bacterium]|jgi:DNA-binding MarR family transcriptional regulator|nr:MarR family transcriptional regulator [Steroidobacteraceae bacterium]